MSLRLCAVLFSVLSVGALAADKQTDNPLEDASNSLLQSMAESDFVAQSACSNCCRGPRGFTGPSFDVSEADFGELLFKTSSDSAGGLALGNNQLVRGNGAGIIPEAIDLLGTANQVSVAQGASTITLSLSTALIAPGTFTAVNGYRYNVFTPPSGVTALPTTRSGTVFLMSTAAPGQQLNLPTAGSSAGVFYIFEVAVTGASTSVIGGGMTNMFGTNIINSVQTSVASASTVTFTATALRGDRVKAWSNGLHWIIEGNGFAAASITVA